MSYLERQGTMNAEVAETIELCIPALPCSPSLEVTHDSADYAGDVYEDSEYPYAPGFLNGVKCCTKCGAIKTPQWREGPFGPKTLCNACGVKRTRKLRAEQDGNKRRRLTASPAKQYTSIKAPVKTVYSQDPLDGYDSQGYDDYADVAYYHPSPIRRPQRRAAEEAAVKTARYARTGEWAKQEALSLPVGPLHTPTSSSDYSLPSSDCPEEVSFTPMAAEAAARSGLPGVPADCYAAVNLMTMSFKQPEETASAPVAQRPQQTPADVNAACAAFEEAVAAKANESGLDPNSVQDLYKTLPPAKVVELVRLNQELDAAVQEAHAANAAVANMAALLATKQAAALRSKEGALAATKRLRRFMIELDTQFGINPKTLPRIRTASKKLP